MNLTGKDRGGACGTHESSADAGEIIPDKEWSIEYLRMTKKNEKRIAKSNFHKSPFAQEMASAQSLNHHYQITPDGTWEMLKKYKQFVLEGEYIAVGDYVFVNHENVLGQKKQGDERDWWKGRVLEIRAEDNANVYVQLAWMYSPDDLPKTKTEKHMNDEGRQSYHGAHELIASNLQDIIHVSCVAGKAAVDFWDESNDSQVFEGMYWRQHFNFQTGELSACRKYCKCKQFYNPNQKMLQCPNSECEIDWLHTNCLEHAIFKKVWNDVKYNYPKKNKAGGKKRKRTQPEPWNGILSGHILHAAKPPVMVVNQVNGDNTPVPMATRPEEILCLGCETTIT